MVNIAMTDTNEDDLYGDLSLAAAKPAPRKQTTASSIEPTASSMPRSDPEISNLQQQIKNLEAENETLKKNIGILYRTAKSELERKDRRIEELQNDLDARR
jgi:septal ring factor EnvC (AmiA/AmiB activator)